MYGTSIRLFIAIRFPEPVRRQLAQAAENLEACARTGRFTRPENLHQTVVFLGGVPRDRTAEIRRMMDLHRPVRTDIVLEGLGRFPRPGGDIHWVGVRQNPAVSQYYADLTRALNAAGFAVDCRPYRPHITLGREVHLYREPDFTFPPRIVPVAKISLMQSARTAGRLVYTPIYEPPLP